MSTNKKQQPSGMSIILGVITTAAIAVGLFFLIKSCTAPEFKQSTWSQIQDWQLKHTGYQVKEVLMKSVHEHDIEFKFTVTSVVKDVTVTERFKTVGVVGTTTLDELIKFAHSTPNTSIETQGTVSVFGVIGNIIMVLLFVAMGASMFGMFKGSRKGGSGGGFMPGLPGMDAASNFRAGKSSVKYTDVAGIQEEKEELLEIVDFLKNPMKYKQMGLRTPRGVLLYGPPGTGKTLLAKATAGEAGVQFLEISGSAVSGIIAGQGALKIRQLFQRASKIAPCIVFIDEIDTIGRKRGQTINQSSDDQQTLNQLLTSMDGFQPLSGVVVMAATNRLQDLDDALLRPGRFDRQIQVSAPDVKERQEIIKVHSRNKTLAKTVTVGEIARRTPGFTGAQIENVMNEAGLLAVRHNKRVITMKFIEEAIERTIGGPAKKSRKRDQFTNQVVAYHEAGHAITALVHKGDDAVEKITIVQRGSAGGYVLQKTKDAYNFETKQDYLDNLIVACGGRAAEVVHFGEEKITSGAYSDFQKVTQISRAMVTKLGMSKLGIIQFEGDERQGFTKPYSEHVAELIDEETNKIAKTAYLQAIETIKKYRKEFNLIAEALLISESLTQKQVQYIYNEKEIPEEVLKLKAPELPEHVEEETVKVEDISAETNDEKINEPEIESVAKTEE